jgi:hypothetical protein
MQDMINAHQHNNDNAQQHNNANAQQQNNANAQQLNNVELVPMRVTIKHNLTT